MFTAVRNARDLLIAAVDDTVTRVRSRGRAALFRALRMSGAAVASWLVAHALAPSTIPILAPLTALLVVQVTLSGTLNSGIERVVSVVAGVLLAIIFSAVVGLTWWSLGALVAVSIVIGQLLKLGPNLVEVPISAMLVLAAGSGAGQTATGRAYETVIGAVVGIAANVVFPPALKALDAGARVERFAVQLARILHDAAAQLSAGPAAGNPEQWLEQARRLSRHVPAIDKEITDADQSRQLNLRALGTPDTSASLRDGLEALEHSLVAVRSLFRSVADSRRDSALRQLGGQLGEVGQVGRLRPSVEADQEQDGADYTRDVREAFALLLYDLALCVRCYGQMLRAEVSTAPGAESEQVELALQALREARARVSELLMLGPRADPQYWELNVALLSTVERVLRELDVEEYVRQRRQLLAAEEHGLGYHAAERMREHSRWLADQASHFGRDHE